MRLSSYYSQLWDLGVRFLIYFYITQFLTVYEIFFLWNLSIYIFMKFMLNLTLMSSLILIVQLWRIERGQYEVRCCYRTLVTWRYINQTKHYWYEMIIIWLLLCLWFNIWSSFDIKDNNFIEIYNVTQFWSFDLIDISLRCAKCIFITETLSYQYDIKGFLSSSSIHINFPSDHFSPYLRTPYANPLFR